MKLLTKGKAKARLSYYIPVFMFASFLFYSLAGGVNIVAPSRFITFRIGLTISGLTFLLLFILRAKKSIIFSSNLLVSLSFVMYYLISSIWLYDGGRPSLLGVIICIVLVYLTDEERKRAYVIIKKFMVIMCALGIFSYIIHMFSIGGFPYDVLEKGNYSFFYNYHFSYLIKNGYSLLRLCCLFEEPGMLGTFLAFILCAEDLKLICVENIILFIAGALTFSLGFFLILAIYFILKNINEPKKWVLVLAFILFYLYVLPGIDTGNYAVNTVIKRLIISEEGLAGNNRTSATFDALFNRTIHSYRALFGYGKGYAEVFGTTDTEGLASIKSYIVNFGFIGTFAMFMPLILGELQYCKNRNMLLYLIVNVISLYQRPYLLQVPYFTMLICGLSYISLSQNDTEAGKAGYKLRRGDTVNECSFFHSNSYI